jgi:hypothetical protein
MQRDQTFGFLRKDKARHYPDADAATATAPGAKASQAAKRVASAGNLTSLISVKWPLCRWR